MSLENMHLCLLKTCCYVPFFQTHAQHIREELARFPSDVRDDVVILFSAHSLPQRVRFSTSLDLHGPGIVHRWHC